MSLPEGFVLRQASTTDLDTLVLHRRAMFHDMGYKDETALDLMSAKFRRWLRDRMNSGDYLAWLVSAPDGSVAAGAGLWLMDWPPHSDPERGEATSLTSIRQNSFGVLVSHAS